MEELILAKFLFFFMISDRLFYDFIKIVLNFYIRYHSTGCNDHQNHLNLS